MIGGVYTADPARLSLRATMPRFQEMEEKHGSVIKGMLAQRSKTEQTSAGGTDSGARYSMFISLDGGLKLLVDSLVAKLPQVVLKLNSAVSRIGHCTEGGWEIVLSDGTAATADAVIIALPAHAAAYALAELSGDLSEQLLKIEYASAAVVNLVYERAQIEHSLDGFGFVVPQGERLSLIAASFSSIKYPDRTAPSKVVLRAFMGGALMPEMNELNDQELIARATSDLAKLLAISGNPSYSCVSRWPRSMPQYHVGHLDLVKRIESHIAKLPGLALAGNAYYGVGIPDCIHSGEQAAARIFQYLMLRS
jgi:oxygen-dependent protoporphyrinogen oxidase